MKAVLRIEIPARGSAGGSHLNSKGKMVEAAGIEPALREFV